MSLFPFLWLQASACHVEETAVFNVLDRCHKLRCRIRLRFIFSGQFDDLIVEDGFPGRRELWMFWTIGEHRTYFDDNLRTTANAFINSEFLVCFAVLGHDDFQIY